MFRIKKIKTKIALLVFMLWPITISTITFNYSFLILPFISKLDLKNKNKILEISLFILFLLVSWIIGVVFILKGHEALRSSLSSISLILPFSLLYFKPIYSLENLKKGVIAACVLYSLIVIYHMLFNLSIPFFYADGAKSLLRLYISDWPQRYIVLIGIAIIFIIDKIKKKVNFTNTFCFLILFYTFYLTFTRTAYVAVAIGIIYYFSPNNFKINVRILKYFLLILLALVIIVVVDYFNSQMLFAIFQKIGNKFSEALTAFDSNSGERSISERFDTWKEILHFVFTTNPISGAGGISASVLKEVGLIEIPSNSAHSQYFDLFLRYGILGIVFIYYFFKRVYIKTSKEIKACLLFLLFFSVTHETIKLTYILLFFVLLINLSYNIETKESELKT